MHKNNRISASFRNGMLDALAAPVEMFSGPVRSLAPAKQRSSRGLEGDWIMIGKDFRRAIRHCTK